MAHQIKSETSKTITKKRSPPKELTESGQLSLFSNFLSNNEAGVSNAIETWEGFPKYHFSTNMQTSLRGDDGLAAPYDWSYDANGSTYTVRVHPASIQSPDGGFVSHFPGSIEEIVEEALKKILTVQNHGIHLAEKQETWVRFSLRQVMTEMKNMGHGITYPRLILALEIMSLSVITVFLGSSKEPVYRGPILSDFVSVGREDYLTDRSARNMARLPVFITHSINSLTYRQFNYDAYMGLSSQLSRWMYKKLVNRYTNANFLNSYHISLVSVISTSALIKAKSFTDKRVHFEKVLSELKSAGVLRDWEIEKVHKDKRIKNKVVDVIYNLMPNSTFISDQKAANARIKGADLNNEESD